MPIRKTKMTYLHGNFVSKLKLTKYIRVVSYIANFNTIDFYQKPDFLVFIIDSMNILLT